LTALVKLEALATGGLPTVAAVIVTVAHSGSIALLGAISPLPQYWNVVAVVPV
jgi:hypothetical protein